MIDPFEQLRQRFRQRAAAQLRLLEQALASGNRHAVRDLAHKLSGSAGTFGFPTVSALAEPLEHAAEAQVSLAELGALAEPLVAELRTIGQAV